jgi:hypothetical protein
MVCGGGQDAPAVLRDGRVLFTGGSGCPPNVHPVVMPVTTGSAQLFDPASGRFSKTGPMTRPRGGHTATLLPDGRVLVTGGSSGGVDEPFASAELYDPQTGKFTPTGSMATPRQGHTATVLTDGRVLVAGGSNIVWSASEGGRTALATAELYDPQTGKFTAAGSMTRARSDHTATLLQDGRLLITGGDEPVTAELYDPATGLFTPTDSRPTLTYVQTATLLDDGRVLVGDGAQAEIFDPATQVFTSVEWVTSACAAHSATRMNTGRVLVLDKCGGAANLFDPVTVKVGPAASKVPAGVGPGTATLLGDGRILNCNGGPAWLYVP